LVEQGLIQAAVDLERILEALQRALNDALGLRAGLAPLNHPTSQFGVAHEVLRELRVSLEFELLDREQSTGSARMARDERHFARDRTFCSPCKVVRRVCGFPVLVRAQQTEVETPAREIEVVRIAAERRDRMLWCE